MARSVAVYHNVSPRYSGGSPAQVDFETALKVVDDERRGYDIALSGAYGENEQRDARVRGLAGIVEEREERADCWLVTDMLTGARFIRLFPEHRPAGLAEEIKWKDKRRTLAARLVNKYNITIVEGIGL